MPIATRPPARRGALVLAVLGVLSAAVACSGEEPATLEELIAPIDQAPPPAGAREESCTIVSDRGPVDLVFDLPRGYDRVEVPGPISAAVSAPELCRWTGPTPPGRGGGPVADTIVTLERVGSASAESLRARAEELRPLVDVGGDDNIADLDLRTDVPAFGSTVGDRLTYLCSCDAISEDVRQAQFAGVRLTFTSRPGAAEVDAAFEAAVASGGVSG